jgi:bacterioferritin (cytochrome b1)
MKGNNKVIDKLNFLLTDELTAVNQYIVHSECALIGGMKNYTMFSKSGQLMR